MAGSSGGQPHRGSSTFEMFAGFIPWITYWALIGSVSFRLAVVIAFALSLALTGASWLRGRPPKILEIGGTVIFAGLLVVTFATDDEFLEQWIQPLTNAGLLAISAASLALGRPFTVEYAREEVSPEVAAMPGFLFINRVITIVWTIAFAVMTAAAAVPPIVEGDATIREGGSTLSIIGYWVVPFTAIGLAAIFSGKFPDWFTSRLGEPGAAPAAAGAPLARLDHPREGALALSAEPREGLLDSGLEIALDGAEPGSDVVIEARTIDALGRGWRSQARFEAGSDGRVDLGSSAPRDGTWSEADATAPIWSMRAESEGTDLFVPSLDVQAIALTVHANGQPPLGAMLARRALGDGVRVVEINEGDVRGRLFLPAGDGPHPGVAVLGGSEGGLDSMAQTAGLLASHGYAAMVIGYFGLEGLPKHLIEIPLERIAAGIRGLASDPRVDGGRIGALAISKGSEGLLATASRIGDLGLRALVAISPSHVVWQAIGDEGPKPDTSSWTLDGRSLPFAPMKGEALMPELLRNAAFAGLDRRCHRPTLLHLAAAYELPNGAAPDDAGIPAERIDAPLLLLAGEADELWPSVKMAEAIASRRSNPGDERHSYPEAGHLIRMPVIPSSGLWTHGIAFGGSTEGLAAAQADAGPRALAFLGKHLG